MTLHFAWDRKQSRKAPGLSPETGGPSLSMAHETRERPLGTVTLLYVCPLETEGQQEGDCPTGRERSLAVARVTLAIHPRALCLHHGNTGRIAGTGRSCLISGRRERTRPGAGLRAGAWPLCPALLSLQQRLGSSMATAHPWGQCLLDFPHVVPPSILCGTSPIPGWSMAALPSSRGLRGLSRGLFPPHPLDPGFCRCSCVGLPHHHMGFIAPFCGCKDRDDQDLSGPIPRAPSSPGRDFLS